MRLVTRTISPRKAPFDYTKFEKEYRREFNTFIRRDMLFEFQKTIVGWRNRPEFRSLLSILPNRISFFIWASGPHANQYNLVNAGASSHIILPKEPGGILKFNRGYLPATKPRVIGSRRAIAIGHRVTARVVFHPGFEGREFYETIGDLYVTDYKRRIKNALERATRSLRREQGM
jgi:hypothetical protein